MHEADHGAMEAEQTDTPPESGESRRERLARDHPIRFLAERVGMAIVEVAVGVLGVGALVGVIFGGVLPRIDWSWLPDVSIPGWITDVSVSEWLKFFDPVYWISRLDVPWPDIDLPGWLTGSTKYWLPVVIALVVALGEIERRRTKADDTDTGLD